MKYFIDTEFIEGFKKPIFGKRRHFIDLISIGIYCEDGRTYQAISNEWNYNDADGWVKQNVIVPLYVSTIHGDTRNRCDASNFHKVVGKSNKEIANEIYQFICPYSNASDYAGVGGIDEGGKNYLLTTPPEFYGYYSDYDWVLFCSLFGRMIDLPKGFPMYCKDLKQILDEKAEGLNQIEYSKYIVEGTNWKVSNPLPKSIIDIDHWGFEERLTLIKSMPNYPKQTNEHNALADAKWNFELYKFLNK